MPALLLSVLKGLVTTALGPALKQILLKLMAEAFLKAILLDVAEHMAAKSDNKLDDKLVAELRKALDEEE